MHVTSNKIAWFCFAEDFTTDYKLLQERFLCISYITWYSAGHPLIAIAQSAEPELKMETTQNTYTREETKSSTL